MREQAFDLSLRQDANAPRPATQSGIRATYTLRYEDDALGIEKRIEFEAVSAAYALEIARAEAEGRRALLLENGRPLCRLVKALAGDAPYWIVADRPTFDNPADPSEVANSARGMTYGSIDVRQRPGQQEREDAPCRGLR